MLKNILVVLFKFVANSAMKSMAVHQFGNSILLLSILRQGGLDRVNVVRLIARIYDCIIPLTSYLGLTENVVIWDSPKRVKNQRVNLRNEILIESFAQPSILDFVVIQSDFFVLSVVPRPESGRLSRGFYV